MNFFGQLLSALLQLLIFTTIPFLWYVVTHKKITGFFQWLGLKTPIDTDKSIWKFVSIAVIGFNIVSIGILFILKDVDTVTSSFMERKIAALPSAFIYAFVKTALSEEILFRGFILKRLSNKLGFKIGNIIQSVLFGLLHGVMFVSVVETMKLLLIVVFTGAIAWCIGYINESKANGSIIPGWIIHGIANLFSAFISMFSVI